MPHGAISSGLASVWRGLAFLLVASLIAYVPVLSKLFAVWINEEEMAHAVFVPVIAAYAVWQSRGKLAQLTPAVYPAALLLCLLAMLLRVTGTLAGEVLLTRLAWLLTTIGILHFRFGTAILRVLAFPLFLLLFAIPIPGVIYTNLTASLQTIASVLSERILDGLDYTVVRSGNILELPGQKLSVAEACSGIRSLISISFLVAVYLYFVEDRGWARWVVVAATIPVTVFINAIRIVITGIVGERDPVFALGLFHATAGWVLSLAGFALLLAIHDFTQRIIRSLSVRRCAREESK
mgnify:CR=1 FL=1